MYKCINKIVSPVFAYAYYRSLMLLEEQRSSRKMTTPLSPLGRATLAASAAALALRNPARADLVAIVGDLTSGPTLHHLTRRLSATSEGRQLLATLPPRFPPEGSACLPSLRAQPPNTLGHQYARFMQVRNFSPDDRPTVRFVEDAQHRWILQRYRDVHDVWHVLTGMPTTVLGELSQKCFEAAQTGLPVAVLSALAAPARLSREERRVFLTQLVPWAISCGSRSVDLLAIQYELYLQHDLEQLRRKWRITKSPVTIKGMNR